MSRDDCAIWRAPAYEVCEIRRRLGYGRRAFAHLLGVSPGVVVSWEAGRSRPRGRVATLLKALIECGEQGEALKQLRESDLRFRGTFENAGVGIVHIDLNFRWLRFNDKFCRIMGYPREELLEKPALEITHPEDRDEDLRGKRALASGEIDEFSMEKRYVRKDGRVIWVKVTAAVQRDDEGRPAYLIAVIEDISERKAAEQNLLESREQLRLALEAAGAGAWIWDVAKSRTEWWEEYRKLAGVGSEVGPSFEAWLASVHPEDRSCVEQYARNVVQSCEPRFAFEYRIIHPEKGIRWIRGVGTAEFAPDGAPLRIVGLNLDITEQRKLDGALREAEERLRFLVDTASDGFFIHTCDGRLLDVNQQACDTLGYSRNELMRLTIFDVEVAFPPDLLRSAWSHVTPGCPKTVLGRHRRKDGTELPMEILMNAYDLRGERVYLGVARDISERVRAQKALRESEARYRTIGETIPYGVWIAEANGGIEYVSQSFLDLVGVTMDDVSGFGWVDRLPTEDSDDMLASWLQCVGSGADWRREMTVRGTDGLSHPVLGVGRPVRDEGGKITSWVGMLLDIGDLKQAQRLRASEARFRSTFENALVGMAHARLADGAFLRVNDRLCEMVGYHRNELGSKTIADITHPDDVAADVEALERARQGEIRTWTREKRYIHKQGHVVWAQVNVAVHLDTSGTPLHTIAIIEDISARKQAEAALVHEKERALVTLHSIGDGVITTDASGLIDYLNPVAEMLTGWNLADARGQPLPVVFNTVDEITRNPLPDLAEQCLKEGRTDTLPHDSVLLERYGREYAIADSVAPLRGRAGDLLGTVVVFRDVTQHRMMERKLEYDASHDLLTGLVNRREFDLRLARAVASAREKGFAHAVCFIDLDQFKVVNDTAGHAAGDALLKQVPALLRGRFRERDTLARLGGDEFAVLLENCPLAEATKIAHRIVSTFNDWRFVWEGRPFQIGASVGVVGITEDSIDEGEVLCQADVACYAAKEAGRNRIHVYQTEADASSEHHTQIRVAARLTEALEQERFRLFCQPIVPLNETALRPLRYEILIRLFDDEAGIILPGRFIPAAERYGLMTAIDRWVVATTFQTYVTHVSPDRAFDVTINLSGLALGREDFAEFVLDQFAVTAMPPRRVCFEITETSAIQNFEQASIFAKRVREIGGSIALDDFGSGLSSFKYLRYLPIDHLKIDGTFVQSIIDSPKDMAMVSAINEIGHKLGLTTIAEYVDRKVLIDTLRDLGVDYAQGYAFGIPEPLENILPMHADAAA